MLQTLLHLLNTSVKKKRKQQDDDQPCVKKPPKAFMLFSKEQRPNVVAELNISDSAAVNKVLRQKWKMLSGEDQAKYYEEAARERLLHAGKKRKKQRRKPSDTR